ncbi:hypothetical protein [Sphingomonas sp.]|uniref:hypothetical protein n=1 Tax=Sphingomonas sp. TaxID=28214 RepID=UPI0025D8F478|nr:hypothetical protein [Sphingomonas sp.]
MNPNIVPRAAGRARWLAELSAALDEAQMLLAQLVAEQVSQADADQLRLSIDELRAELKVLHRRGFAAEVKIELRRPLHSDWRPRRG